MKIKNLGQGFAQRMREEKNVARVVKFNEEFTTWQQRLVLGVASISTQPLFDYFNKDVDEETRKYSTARTMAKIIVGTSEGCLVRYMVIRYGKKIAFNWLRNPDVTSKIAKHLDTKIVTLQSKSLAVENKLQHLDVNTKAFSKNKETKDYLDKSVNNFQKYKGNFAKWVEEFEDPDLKFDPDKFRTNENLKDLNTFLGQAGAALSVVAAFGAALFIDIPMTNKALNWGMEKLFPDCKKKGDDK